MKRAEARAPPLHCTNLNKAADRSSERDFRRIHPSGASQFLATGLMADVLFPHGCTAGATENSPRRELDGLEVGRGGREPGSVAPVGAFCVFTRLPTADAVGYVLPLLRSFPAIQETEMRLHPLFGRIPAGQAAWGRAKLDAMFSRS